MAIVSKFIHHPIHLSPSLPIHLLSRSESWCPALWMSPNSLVSRSGLWRLAFRMSPRFICLPGFRLSAIHLSPSLAGVVRLSGHWTPCLNGVVRLFGCLFFAFTCLSSGVSRNVLPINLSPNHRLPLWCPALSPVRFCVVFHHLCVCLCSVLYSLCLFLLSQDKIMFHCSTMFFWCFTMFYHLSPTLYTFYCLRYKCGGICTSELACEKALTDGSR